MTLQTIPVEMAFEELSRFASEGLMFHGSPVAGLTIINMKSASDSKYTDPNHFNNDTAVFATPYPEASIVFALVPNFIKKSGISSFRYAVGSSDDGIVIDVDESIKQITELDVVGSVYVLPGDLNWIRFGWQVKTHTDVKPLYEVTVNWDVLMKFNPHVRFHDD